MEIAKNEGLRRVNNIPLPIECLIMPSTGETPNWPYAHYHEYIELLYVLEGDCEVKRNSIITYLPEHSMYIIQAGEPHCTRRVSRRQNLLCIKFLPQVLYSSEQSVTELEYSIPYVFEHFSDCRYFSPELLQDTFIPKIMEELCIEKAENDFGYELALRAHMLRIFLWIIRYWHKQAGAPQLATSNPNTAAMLCRAREYVEANYATVTLTDVARECGLSYGYFSRMFNTYMKTSFNDYVNQVRVNESMKLLATTDMSITEIALAMGFSTTSYYIQVFKKLKSISPNKFRKQFRGNQLPQGN